MKVFQLNARKIDLLLRILQISMRDTCSRIICHRTRFYSISIWFFYISFHFYSRKISPVLFITVKILYILYDWNVKSSNLVNALVAKVQSIYTLILTSLILILKSKVNGWIVFFRITGRIFESPLIIQRITWN